MIAERMQGESGQQYSSKKLRLLYKCIRGKVDRQCSLPGHEGQKALFHFISSCCQHLSAVLNSFYHQTLDYSKQLYQIPKSFTCCWFYTGMSLSTKPYGVLRCWKKLSSFVHECNVFSIVNSVLNEPRLAYATSQLIWIHHLPQHVELGNYLFLHSCCKIKPS